MDVSTKEMVGDYSEPRLLRIRCTSSTIVVPGLALFGFSGTTRAKAQGKWARYVALLSIIAG